MIYRLPETRPIAHRTRERLFRAFARPSTEASHHDVCSITKFLAVTADTIKAIVYLTSGFLCPKRQFPIGFKTEKQSKFHRFFPSFTRFSVIHSLPTSSSTVARNRTNLYLTNLYRTQLTRSSVTSSSEIQFVTFKLSKPVYFLIVKSYLLILRWLIL